MKTKGCESCPLYNKAFVLLEKNGDPPLDILFIGEAPGVEEEKLGRPFVGRSGQILREKLTHFVLRANPLLKYGITNVVKCRPDNNETPDKSLVEKCRPFVDKEILDYKPKVIVLLGRVALKYFLGFDSVTKYVNTVLEKDMPYGRVSVIVTYHPASVLRDIGKMADFELTFSRIIPRVLEKGKSNIEFQYTAIETCEEMERITQKIVSEADCLAFDLEAPSIQVPIKPSDSPIFTISLAVRYKDGTEGAYAIPLIKDECMYVYLKTIMESDIKKIAHNGKYDVAFLKVNGIEVNNFIFDTMIAHHLYDENLPHNLGYLITEFTPFVEHKSEFWKTASDKMEKLLEDYRKGEISQESEIFIQELLEYNAKDAYSTLLSYYKLKDLLDQDKLDIMEVILVPLSLTLMEMEINGVKIDTNALTELEREYATKLSELYSKIVDHPWVKKFVSDYKKDVNLNSSLQISTILYDIGKLPIIKTSKKTNKPSTGKEVLLQLAEKSDFVRDLLDYRKANKIYTAFIKEMPKHLLSDRRIHPRYNVVGTVTGRLSSESPNIQQIPHGSHIRRMFVSRFPDGVLIEADYSQLELRLTATISGDENLLHAYWSGEDLHRKTAAVIFNKSPEEITDRERRIAKGVNFGVVYGITPLGLIDNLAPLGIYLTEREAEKYIQAFFTAYPQVKNWILKVRSVAKEKRIVHSIFGVERHLMGLSEEDMRQAVNFIIQSSGAYFSYIALNSLMKKFKSLGLLSRPIITVHDSIVVDAPEGEVEIVKQLLQESMVNKVTRVVSGLLMEINYPEIPGKKLSKIEIDISVGKNWYFEKESFIEEELNEGI